MLCEAVLVCRAMQQISRIYYDDKLAIDSILLTHKHWDHAAGQKQMQKDFFPNIKIYASEDNLLRKK